MRRRVRAPCRRDLSKSDAFRFNLLKMRPRFRQVARHPDINPLVSAGLHIQQVDGTELFIHNRVWPGAC